MGLKGFIIFCAIVIMAGYLVYEVYNLVDKKLIKNQKVQKFWREKR